MTFRLPFQIFRAVSRPTSPIRFLNPSNLAHTFQKSCISSLVDANNNVVQRSKDLFLKPNTSVPSYIPQFSFHRFKSTFKGLPKNTNLENRKKVRKQHKCHERKCERQLVFRDTTREECDQCVSPILVPDKCPKLPRLKPQYDASQLTWKHEDCPIDPCEITPRMDDLKGYKVTRKKLPKLQNDDCDKCLAPKPKTAPKLTRPLRDYDPSKLKWKHPVCIDFCDDAAPRMDDVRGYKVTPKKLPTIESDDCPPCTGKKPCCAPKLTLPKKRYDPYELEQKRDCVEDTCNIDPPRMDDIRGYKVVNKELPPLPAVDDCPQCLNKPKCMPKLPRLKKRYDPSKMTWNHPVCADFCDLAAPRMDDVMGVHTTPKQLPKLKSNCEKCIPNIPTILPKLGRLKRKYDDKKMKWNHEYCPPEECEEHPPRSDNVLGLKIKRKKLPKLEPSQECTYCTDVPTRAPRLIRPLRQYDDSKLKWKHECPPEGCDAHPPRIDDIVGYKVTPKKLKKLPISKDCRPCQNKPTCAPKLERPLKRYDPSKMKWKHPDCSEFCDVAVRMDDVVGFKVTPKKLPTISAECCPQCVDRQPKYAPELKRLRKRYDPSKMKWKHPNCEEFCVDAVRMDDVVGLKVTPKKLPNLPALDDCSQCLNHVPKYAPKLKRPKRKYDPKKLERPPEFCDDICDLDPPRMDDVLCWKPKKKILPSFNVNSCQQTRKYSTLSSAVNKVTYCIYSTRNMSQLRENAHMYGRRYSSKRKKPKHCKKSKKNKVEDNMVDYNGKDMTFKAEKACIPTKESPCKPNEKECKRKKSKHSKNSKQCNKSKKNKFKKFECKAPKPTKCMPPCPRLKRLPFCKKPFQPYCKDYIEKTCKKTEAPYSSYGDCTDGFYEDGPQECINTNEIMLQPQKQVSGHFYHIKPPPPKFEPIDPSLERKCIAEIKPCPVPPDKKDPWTNPCPEFKMKFCKPRGRKHCNEFKRRPKCKKLEAPYKSFTDYCPQFPEVQLNECEIADKIYKNNDNMVDFNGKDMTFKAEKASIPTKENPCKPNEKGCKPKKKKDEKCRKIPKCRQKDKEKGPCKPVKFPAKRTKCGKKKSKSKKNKKKTSKNLPNNPKKSKCQSNPNIKAMICTAKDGSKQICVCLPIKEKQSKSNPDVCGSTKTTKSKSKSEVCCPPIKVSSKSKCKTSSHSSSPSGFSGMKQKQVSIPPPTKASPPRPPPGSSDGNSMWNKICSYFKARPGCPGPHEWRQKQLEEKAREAAAAAGFEVCEPKCQYVNLSKCQQQSTGQKKNTCCTPKKKSGSLCGCTMPKSNTCKPTSPVKCPPPPTKKCKKSKCSKSVTSKCSTSVTSKCPRPKQKKKYSTVARNRYFNTYTRCSGLYKHTNNTPEILTYQINVPSNSKSLNYSKEPPTKLYNPYLRCDNNYIGKLYQLKFRKIGIRNSLVKRKVDEEPYTICHMCKVIPKHQFVFHKSATSIKNLNLKNDSERRQNM